MKASLNRYAYAIAVLMLAGYALITLRGPHGLHALTGLQTQIREQEKSNARLAERIQHKRHHVELLESNPAQQELEIRQRLKLVKPNEKIIVIDGRQIVVEDDAKK